MRRRYRVIIVSLIDNPSGLSKEVLQLMDQEGIIIKYTNISLAQSGGPANEPLSYWEEKVGNPLMQENRVKEPNAPPIIHWETNRILKPFQAYLLGRHAERFDQEDTVNCDAT